MPETEKPVKTRKPKPTYVPTNPHGRPSIDKADLAVYAGQPRDKQREKTEAVWSEVAYVLAQRALSLGLTVTKKDLGRLQQLVTSAGIAKDKVFPVRTDPPSVNIALQMFGSIPSATLRAISMPRLPEVSDNKPYVKLADGSPLALRAASVPANGDIVDNVAQLSSLVGGNGHVDPPGTLVPPTAMEALGRHVPTGTVLGSEATPVEYIEPPENIGEI